jgi:DNA polymerase III alpha subunit (gram-positive type)
VARHKTGLDEAGKALGEVYRDSLNAINERRRTVKQRLEALQADVARPVDEWERQDKARTDMVQGILSRIDTLSAVSIDTASSDVQARISELQKMEIEHSAFQEMWDAAITNRDKAVDMLTRAFERLQKQEQEAAELAKLRADAAEREARDAEIVRELELEAIRENERREQERLEKERAEASRIQAEQFAARAAEDARVKAEKAAADALAEQQRMHQAELDRLRQEREAKEALERQESEEEARRQSDEEHRQKVMGEVFLCVCGAAKCDSSSKMASHTVRLIVEAIADGRVPHVKMEF